MLRDGSVGVEATWCGVESESSYEERCSRLHRTLKRIVKARGALDAQEAAALREAEQLRLWRQRGYSSLLEYMEMEMGYSPRAALERLRVAKAIVDLPLIAEAMEQGDLSFSAGRELTRVATPETEGEWIEAANDKNLRQVEELVAGHDRGAKPTDPKDPSLRRRNLRYEDIENETVALLRQAREILEREQGERLTDNGFLRTFARMVIDGAASPERPGAPYQVAVTICEQCKRGWQSGGGITVEISPPALEVALCDTQHIGSLCETAPADDGDLENDMNVRSEKSQTHEVDDTESAVSESNATTGGVVSKNATTGGAVAPPKRSQRARSDISPALRRKVKHRDHRACRVPWCRSSRNVDCHHIIHVSKGGKHTLENLICLCESHHIAHHEGALLIEGTASNPTFLRHAHNSFSIEERAVDTRRALEDLGFDKHEVKVAIEKTRTHVGTAELTIEQWIKIALGYCPKPRA